MPILRRSSNFFRVTSHAARVDRITFMFDTLLFDSNYVNSGCDLRNDFSRVKGDRLDPPTNQQGFCIDFGEHVLRMGCSWVYCLLHN